MTAPRNMTAQTLNALKGWPQMAAVDFNAAINMALINSLAAANGSTCSMYPGGIGPRLQAGSVVHINPSTGLFEPGAGQYSTDIGSAAGQISSWTNATGTNRNADCMPMFLFNASDDPDVFNDGGDPSTVKGVFVAISPTGQAMALVAVGAYELVTTAFATAGTTTGSVAVTEASYTPGTWLTSPRAGLYAGLVSPGVLYKDVCVGMVSRGIVDNGYGFDAVSFWPNPVYPNSTGS